MAEVEDVLAHFGVKGMKWGSRKSASSGGHPTSDDHANARASKAKVKKHGTKALSNKEIQELIQRINLEGQVKNLTSKGSSFKKGHSVVKEILGVGATVSAAIAFASSPAGKAVKAGITAALKK